jgi:hypothetical protein
MDAETPTPEELERDARDWKAMEQAEVEARLQRIRRGLSFTHVDDERQPEEPSGDN